MKHSKYMVSALAIGAMSLTLSGCKKVDEQEGSGAKGAPLIGDGGGGLNEKGLGVLHGCDPRKSVGDCDESNHKEFAPIYYMVKYLDFGRRKGHGFTARHAYFKQKASGQYPDKTELKCAINWVKKQTTPFSQGKPENQTEARLCRGVKAVTPGTIDPHRLAKHRKLPGSDRRGPYKALRTNFDGLTFGGQQNVFVVLGDDNVKFNTKMPISFTPFGAFDFEPGKRATRAANNSFFEAKVYGIKSGSKVSNPFAGTGYSGLHYKNYFLDGKGDLITENSDAQPIYSMNINILLCQTRNANKCKTDEPGYTIPVAIDPDTGNGWGSEPYAP